MLKSLYTVIMTGNVNESMDFYKKFLGFTSTFEASWYVSLVNENGFELAIIDRNHETIPKSFQNSAQGVILNFEVDNVDELYEKFVAAPEIEMIQTIRSEDFGQRHFIISDLNNILIDIIQPIGPSAEFLEQFKDAQ